MKKYPFGPPVYLAFLFIGPFLLLIGLYDSLTQSGINALPLAAGSLLLAAGLRYRKQARALSERSPEESPSFPTKATLHP